MIKGQPGSNKSDYAKMIAKHYNIPVIKIKKLIKDADDIKDDKQLKKDFKKEKDKIKQYLKEKKEVPLNESLKVLYRLVRWRLRQNDCRNRGFVINDFPDHLEEFQYIFFKKLEKKLKRKVPKKKKKKPVAKPQDLNQSGEKPPAGDDSQIQDRQEDVEKPEGDEENKQEVKEEPVETQEEDKKSAKSGKSKGSDESGSDSEEEEYEEEGAPGEGTEGAEGENPEDRPADEEQPPEEEEEEEEEEGEGPRVEPYFPDALIYFKKHMKPQDSSESSSDEEKERKFQQYEKSTKLYDYFRDRNMDIYIFDPSNKEDDFERFSSLRVFIEKDGRPNNYLETEEELAKKHFDYYIKKHQGNVQTLESEKARDQGLLDQERNRREHIAKEELTYLVHHEIPDPEEKNKPFRNYLMEYITPILGEGLLHISDILPDDPVDYLAEYLFKKSFELSSTTQKKQ